MVDSKETDQKKLKELLKNKKTVKGTPLFRYANRYASYFVLALGCAHVSVGYITYKADVSDYWLTSGSEYIERKSISLGMYQKDGDQAIMRFEEVKEDFKDLLPNTLLAIMSDHFYRCKERFFSKSPVDAPSESCETIKEANIPTGSSSNSSLIKDTLQ